MAEKTKKSFTLKEKHEHYTKVAAAKSKRKRAKKGV